MKLYKKLTGGLIAAATAIAGQSAVAQYSPYPTTTPAYSQPAYQPQQATPSYNSPATYKPQAAVPPAYGSPAPATQQAYQPATPPQGPSFGQPAQGQPSAPGYNFSNYSTPPARVAMQRGDSLPAPTEAIDQGVSGGAQASGGSMNSVVAPSYKSTPSYSSSPSPAPSYSANPSVASYPAASGCGCNSAQPAANWEGYMPAASEGCATGDCGGYSCDPGGYYATGDCGYNGGYASCAPARPARQWFAGFYGLYMGRDNPGAYPSAYIVDSAPAGTYYPQPGVDSFFYTDAADVDFTGGAEVRFGSTLGCATDPCTGCTYQPCAWELGFWGLAEDSSFAEITDVDGYGGTTRIYGGINYAGLEYDRDGASGGTYAYRPVNDYYDYQMPIDSTSTNDIRVQAVRVTQTFQVQNLELNFWRFGAPGVGAASAYSGGGLGGGMVRGALGGGCGTGSCGTGACSTGCYDTCGCDPCGGYGECGCAPTVAPRRFFINGLFGVRYLKMDETFRNAVFFANATDIAYPGSMPTSGAGAGQVLFHDIEVDNDLVGFQLGCSMNCLVGCRWTLFCDTNFGIYGNQIDAYQRVYNPGGGGVVRFVETGGDAAVRSSKEDVAFLGEVRCGFGYQITPRIRLTNAYRAIAVSGVALSGSQIQTPVNEAAFGYIDSNDSIIIHGYQGGIEFKY